MLIFLRSFSAMRRLKEWVDGERLSGLTLLYVHKYIVPDFNKVIDVFSEDNRRVILYYIFISLFFGCLSFRCLSLECRKSELFNIEIE